VPINNIVTPGGLHIHHYVWGLFIVLVVGFLALTLNQPKWHPRLAIPFGIGAALVLDEFALLLNLQDVYWAKQGRQSLDAVVLALALLGCYLVAERFWRSAAREVAETLRELRPAT
jgi:lysyl-tRNA synthetase class 2